MVLQNNTQNIYWFIAVNLNLNTNIITPASPLFCAVPARRLAAARPQRTRYAYFFSYILLFAATLIAIIILLYNFSNLIPFSTYNTINAANLFLI